MLRSLEYTALAVFNLLLSIWGIFRNSVIYIDVRPKKGSADPRINDLGLTPPEYINPALGNA